jgi:hypothetical protein
MREIKIIQPLLFVDRPEGNELLGLPRYIAPLLGKRDPEGNPLLTWLESVSPRSHPHIEIEITLRAYERGDATT